MMRLRPGLRLRFVAALIAVVTVTAAGFAYAIYRVIEQIELQLLDRNVRNELDEFVAGYQHDPDIPLLHWGGLRRYAATPDQLDALPPELRALAPGFHDDVRVGGDKVHVGRQDLGDTRLYVTLDIMPIEMLEGQLRRLLWAGLAIGYILAVTAALLLARLVTRPVTELAQRVASLDPRQRHVSLTHRFGDREIGVIAQAFDRFLLRLDEFVAREQAFTEDAGHELRTPLSVILSAVQLLKDEPTLTNGARVRVRRIQRASEQMQSLIDALLFLAHEEEATALESSAVDELVRESVETHRELLSHKPVTLDVGVAEPLTVRAPVGMAACVVNNLLINAINNTEQGHIDVRVEEHVLSVQDTGIGIPQGDLSRIFERRYRGAQSRGLGLGLYLVKGICNRLGWDIRVISVPDAGARFEVHFTSAV